MRAARGLQRRWSRPRSPPVPRVEVDDDRVAVAANMVGDRLCQRDAHARHRRPHRLDGFHRHGGRPDWPHPSVPRWPRRRRQRSEVEQHGQRIRPRGDVRHGCRRLDDQRRARRTDPRGNRGEPRRRRRCAGRGARMFGQRRRQHERKEEGNAPGHSHSLIASQGTQQFSDFARASAMESGSCTSCSTMSPCGVTDLTIAVGELVARVQHVGFVVRALDHREQRAAALHDTAHRDLAEGEAGGAVATLHWRRFAATAEQIDERIAAAVDLVDERVGRHARRRRWRRRGRWCGWRGHRLLRANGTGRGHASPPTPETVSSLCHLLRGRRRRAFGRRRLVEEHEGRRHAARR